tara:strand:+ start:781 stop:1500 length:720 start_codon:yes stop_codon:yes gene_type:complete
LAFSTITFFIICINKVSALKNIFPNYSLQLAGLIGNTSFLGIPIAMALFPEETNFTIGFDLGTTLFSWLFGPYLLQDRNNNKSYLNFRKIISAIFSNPASKGIIGALIIYLFGLENAFKDLLEIPTKVVLSIALIVVGSRLGIIANGEKIIFQFKEFVKYSLFLKLFILPVFIYIVCQILNIKEMGTTALVLQAGTPSAISTILLAEAYKRNRELAAKTLFTTTIVSIATMPIIFLILN